MRGGWAYNRNNIHSSQGINDREEKITGPRRLCRHEIKAAEGFESSVSTADKTLNFILKTIIGIFSE
jgi:hypothetical protein